MVSKGPPDATRSEAGSESAAAEEGDVGRGGDKVTNPVGGGLGRHPSEAACGGDN